MEYLGDIRLIKKSQTAINLIKRGEDGINIEELHKNIIFASRRHLVKNLEEMTPKVGSTIF